MCISPHTPHAPSKTKKSNEIKIPDSLFHLRLRSLARISKNANALDGFIKCKGSLREIYSTYFPLLQQINVVLT